MGSYLVIATLDRLTTLDVSSLRIMGRELEIYKNARLSAIVAPNLTKVGGFIKIFENSEALRPFNGLPRLSCVANGYNQGTLSDCSSELVNRVMSAVSEWSSTFCQNIV